MILWSFKIGFPVQGDYGLSCPFKKGVPLSQRLGHLGIPTSFQKVSRRSWHLDKGALPGVSKVPTGVERQVTWHQRQVIGSAEVLKSAVGFDFVSTSFLCPVLTALVHRCS